MNFGMFCRSFTKGCCETFPWMAQNMFGEQINLEPLPGLKTPGKPGTSASLTLMMTWLDKLLTFSKLVHVSML